MKRENTIILVNFESEIIFSISKILFNIFVINDFIIKKLTDQER